MISVLFFVRLVLAAVITVFLGPVASHYSATHDNHPSKIPFQGPFWQRLNPFRSWPHGCRIDPWNALIIGFVPAFLFPAWWATVLWLTLVAGYVRFVEPKYAPVAPPWEPEDIRDAAVGAMIALLTVHHFGAL